MNIWLRVIALFLLASGGYAGWCLGGGIPFSEQWPLFESLRTTAAIIFAVVGAWFAIIYPERMKGIIKEPFVEKVKVGEGIDKLFSPIVHSTVILCAVLFIGVLAPIVKEIDFFLQHKVLMRKASYGILITLTFWQIWTVLVTLIPALLLKNASDQQALDDANAAAYLSNKKKK